jgi:D-glycero-D-manno-heptose 1,7-bisphosphate phosphatase
VFLDRDGVINENRADYVKSWAEVSFLPRALTAIRRLSQSCYRLVIVTNQSAVGRGIISLRAAQEINQRLLDAIGAYEGRIDGVYMCPHHPDAACGCRKPQPGLLLRAAAELSIDLEGSYLVGDSWSDLAAAQAAGVRGILVLTGRGRETAQCLSTEARAGIPVLADLWAATDYILGAGHCCGG